MTQDIAPAPSGLSLIGLRGTGKSTVGRLLAARLGRDFADADAVLEARAGRTIRAIFSDDGEPAFRDWEERVVTELTARPGLVLATGGGVVLRESNRARLRAYGPVVWLAAPPAVLATRLAADSRGLADRPALTAAGTLGELAAVLSAREPLYRDLADLVVDTSDRTPEEVVDAVVAGLLDRGGRLG
ncbi:MAG: shikimate kinase [Isosphaeraceae bacterium]|nr:shikimate kinase [Isosphaeraceae bacterium]